MGRHRTKRNVTSNKLRHIVGALSTVFVVAISGIGIVGSFTEQTPWQYVERKFLQAFLSGGGDETQAVEPVDNTEPNASTEPVTSLVSKDETFNPNPPVVAGNRQTIVTLGPDGIERRYILHIGQNYNPMEPQPIPVVFSFHGWNQPAEDYIGYSHFESTPAWNESIIIYPEGLDGAWEGAPYATGRPGKDLEFVQQIIDEVDRDYLIDKSRIYSTGFSNGGGMATVLACHMPGTFAAIVSVAGAYYQPVNYGCQGLAIPSLVVHAVNDEIVRYEGGPRNGGQLIPAWEISNQYALRNGCLNQPPTVSELPLAERLTFEGCTGATQHIRILEGGHNWPVEPDIANEVWGFLVAQSRT